MTTELKFGPEERPWFDRSVLRRRPRYGSRPAKLRPPLVVLAAIGLLIPISPAWASDPVGLCSSGLNGYGNQYSTRSGFHGIYAHLITYDPVVPSYTTQFSLSHIYGDQNGAYNSNTFIEDGWAKGYGRPTRSYTHYYRAWSDAGGYHQFDDTDYPDANSVRLYEFLKLGYDQSTGKYEWAFYYAITAYTRGPPVLIIGLNTVAPAIGGEVAP